MKNTVFHFALQSACLKLCDDGRQPGTLKSSPCFVDASAIDAFHRLCLSPLSRHRSKEVCGRADGVALAVACDEGKSHDAVRHSTLHQKTGCSRPGWAHNSHRVVAQLPLTRF